MIAATMSVPGPSSEERERSLLAKGAHVDRNGIAEQDEHERERRDDAQRGRFEPDVEEAEP